MNAMHSWQEFMEGYYRCKHCGLLRKHERHGFYTQVYVRNYYRGDKVSNSARTFPCDPQLLIDANETS
jgi:hypothetical protein